MTTENTTPVPAPADPLFAAMSPVKAAIFTEEIIDAISRYGNITGAAESLNLHGEYLYRLIGRDPELASRVRVAMVVAADRLELVAYTRAVEGWDEPVYFKGVECGSVRKYSDKLLALLLAAHKPYLYGPLAMRSRGAAEAVLETVGEFAVAAGDAAGGKPAPVQTLDDIMLRNRVRVQEAEKRLRELYPRAGGDGGAGSGDSAPLPARAGGVGGKAEGGRNAFTVGG